jgi:hypothetical protein
MAVKTGTRPHTRRRVTASTCSMRAPCRAPIACESCEVSPVESPTQQAIIRNSSGIDSPTAATAASPSVAA